MALDADMRSATKRGDRAEAMCSRICRIDGGSVVAYGELALNPAAAIGNDLAGTCYDLTME